MNRRAFLKGITGGLTLLGLGGLLPFALGQRGEGVLPEPLNAQLRALVDPRFAGYARGQRRAVLLSALVDRGILATHTGIDPEIVAALAQHEDILVYQGFHYSRSELDLYALAFLYHQPDIRV
jgi:hypothetical protein